MNGPKDWDEREWNEITCGSPLWGAFAANTMRYSYRPGIGRFQDDSDTRLRRPLVPGEKLLWTGQPDGHFHYRSGGGRRAIRSIPLLFIGWFVVREALATRETRREGIGEVSDATLNWLVAGACLLTLMGLYRILLDPLLDAYNRKRTIYGLTEQRVIVAYRDWLPALSLAIEPIDFMRIESGPGGTGSVVLQSGAEGWLFPTLLKWPGLPFQLRWIENPTEVVELLVRSQARILAKMETRSWSWTDFQVRLILMPGETLLWSGTTSGDWYRIARKTVFGVTDQRVIRYVAFGRPTRLDTISLTNVSAVTVTPSRDRDSGTVTISRIAMPGPDSSTSSAFELEAVHNAQRVAAIVNQARRTLFDENRVHRTWGSDRVQRWFPDEKVLWAEQHASLSFGTTIVRRICGLTDHQAVVVDVMLGSERVRSLPLASIRELDFFLHANGYGSVGCASDARQWLTEFERDFGNRGSLFFPIRNPEFVFHLMIKTMIASGLTIERVSDNVVRVIE